MPIYEFACRSCGHHFDQLQKLSAADPTICPNCHAQELQRMLSAPVFRLAGTGWYETDFKKAGDHQHNLAGDAGAPAPAGSTADPKHAEKAAEHGTKAADAGTASVAPPVAAETKAGVGAGT